MYKNILSLSAEVDNNFGINTDYTTILKELFLAIKFSSNFFREGERFVEFQFLFVFKSRQTYFLIPFQKSIGFDKCILYKNSMFYTHHKRTTNNTIFTKQFNVVIRNVEGGIPIAFFNITQITIMSEQKEKYVK